MIQFRPPLFDSHDAHVKLIIAQGNGNWVPTSPRSLAVLTLSTERRCQKSLEKMLQAGIIECRDADRPTLQSPNKYRTLG